MIGCWEENLLVIKRYVGGVEKGSDQHILKNEKEYGKYHSFKGCCEV